VREWSDIPIIILCDKSSEMDEARCLDMGADDFIIRPYSMEILLSRVKAVIRRAEKKKYVSEYSLASSLQAEAFNLSSPKGESHGRR
jgi:DNA-binding response OmpR family regulator